MKVKRYYNITFFASTVCNLVADFPLAYELILKDYKLEYRALSTKGLAACNMIGFTEFVMR